MAWSAEAFVSRGRHAAARRGERSLPPGPAPGLFAVGPLTRAAVREALAVPDLRNQTADVARAVAESLTLARPYRPGAFRMSSGAPIAGS